jgi:hypothetical protein
MAAMARLARLSGVPLISGAILGLGPALVVFTLAASQPCHAIIGGVAGERSRERLAILRGDH